MHMITKSKRDGAATAAQTTAETPAGRELPSGLVIGLIAGGVVGVMIGVLFAPRRLVHLRGRAIRTLGGAASAGYNRAGTMMDEAVYEVATKAKEIREDVSAAVSQGVHEAQQFADGLGSAH
jgi:gas vesicle protein